MPPFTVFPAAAHELLPACRLLFTDHGAEQRRDRLLADADTYGVFVARAGGKLCAAALVQIMPGALGIAWPPRGESVEAVDAVTAAACEWLRAHGAKVSQAFATASEREAMAPLEHAGFRHTTQLLLMRHEVRAPSPVGSWRGLIGRYYLPTLRARFAETILATHAGTLDCPELNASRTADEVIAGFAFPDGPWSGGWLAEVDESAVGVFVVKVSPDRDSLELSYLGVVPAARGRGYGDELVRRVLYDASFVVASVTLTVDARNASAMKLYARHGFVEYDRREVWLASWPS